MLPLYFMECRMNIDYIVTRDEDGVYCASVPALPGCFTDGRTLAELRDNVREAVAGVLESYAMLPPGADPHAIAKETAGARIRTLSLRFAKPTHRRTARVRRHEAALV